MDSRLEEEFLTCIVCHEVFRDPVTLHCGHTFCTECVTAYTKTQHQAIARQCIPCPHCRAFTKAVNPQQSVEQWARQMKTGFFVKGLVVAFVANKHGIMSSEFPTPDLSHLTSADYEEVYEPAEDSFLFLDALESEQDFLAKLNPSLCLEIGSGSGVCITFLAKILGPHRYYMSTDINPKAAAVTRRTAERNSVCVEPVVTDMVGCLQPCMTGQIDVLLFNPPYVVTPSEEVGSTGIEASWAGGHRGREVTDRLFPLIPSILSPKGVFYLVIIKENDQDEIEDLMNENGFQMSVVKSRRSGPEFLSILKFTRSPAVT